jgi:hypothetical protein
MAYTNPNISTSSTTFAELQDGGLTSVLETLITVNGGGTAAPTVAATLSESGSGGTLPAATYFVVVTETNGIGETTAGPVSSGQAITLGQDLVVTFQALKSGNTARNTYVGTSNTGPFTLVATGTSAATLTISAPLPSNSYAVNPPTVNSTAFTYSDANGNTLNQANSNIRAAETGNLQYVYNALGKSIDSFLRGDPMSFRGSIMKVREAHVAFSCLAQACADIGTLIDANPGHFAPTATGIGNSQNQRFWP